MLCEPKDFTDHAPNAIASDRIADGARRDRHSKPWIAVRIGTRSDLEERLTETLPALVDMLELRRGAEALAGAERERPDRNSAAARYGERRLRPFARRRLNT